MGSICFLMIFHVPEPDSRAAAMNGASFMAITWLLAILAYFGQDIQAKMCIRDRP